MQAAVQPGNLVEADVHAHADGHDHPHHGFFRTYIWSHDHKMIGKQYLIASMFFGAISGLLAMAVRWQLGFPGKPMPIIGWLLSLQPNSVIVNPDGSFLPGGYNMLVTMHATVMVFFVIMPLLIGVFGNYLIPLKIGAPDMAFPFFNELSFWVFFLSGGILLYAFFVPGGAPAGGWTSYAPLSTVEAYNHTRMGQTLWAAAIFVNGLASIMGAFNYITTVVNMRCPGMTMFRLPLAVWSLFITAILLLLAVPVLSAAGAMIITDLNFGTTFFSAYRPDGTPVNGSPLLYQHLFWFFGHPEVYIMILPAMGLVSEIMPVFARKPIFGYRAMIFSICAIGFLGFIVWGHHMFVSGMNLVASAVFSLSTMVIAVPSAIKVFNWMGTIWKGSIRFTTAMCFCLAFESMFVIGGLSGIFMASTPVDLFIHHTYLSDELLRFGVFGAVFYGFSLTLLRFYPVSNFWGPLYAVGSWLLFVAAFFPTLPFGSSGMMRRGDFPADHEATRQALVQNLHLVRTMIVLGFGLVQTAFLRQAFRQVRARGTPGNRLTTQAEAGLMAAHQPRRYLWHIDTPNRTAPFFERTSKRRRGFPSETNVKRGVRVVHGDKDLVEKLGRNDPCPCGSTRRFKHCCLRSGFF